MVKLINDSLITVQQYTLCHLQTSYIYICFLLEPAYFHQIACYTVSIGCVSRLFEILVLETF